jgi:hypothetical protein
MREVLATLEMLRAVPSHAVEKSGRCLCGTWKIVPAGVVVASAITVGHQRVSSHALSQKVNPDQPAARTNVVNPLARRACSSCARSFGQIDDVPDDNLPEPVRLTAEEYAEALAREEQYRREWAAINCALRDNSMAVTRAMSRWYPAPAERERRTERVMTRLADGSFLLNRLGAEGVIDQDLATVLLHFRNRLSSEYGQGPAAMMLIDRAIAAYQDFIRIEGWIGNTALLIEHEFFGIKGPSANFQDRYGREGRTIRGLTVEQHIARLRDELLPIADALTALGMLRAVPSHAVEKSKPVKVSVMFG